MNGQETSAGAADPGGLLTFQGTHFEVGRLHGLALRRPIRNEMEHGWRQIAAGRPLDRAVWFARFHDRHLPWVRRHLPQVEAEVAGLAEGADLSFVEAFFAAFHGGVSFSPDALSDECTAFYCGPEASRNGALFIGQTKDTGTPPGRYVAMRMNYRDGADAVLLNYPGWLANIGLTSRGMAFTGNARYAAPHKGDPDGLPLSLLKKVILEAGSVPEVRRLIEAFPWQDGCLLIADRTGNAIRAEFIGGASCLADLGAGIFAHANTILAPEAASRDRSAERSPSSAGRQRRARAFLNAKMPLHDFETLRELTRDHESAPSSICLHPPLDPAARAAAVTTAAMIANLTSGHLELAVGQPCLTPFIRYRVE